MKFVLSLLIGVVVTMSASQAQVPAQNLLPPLASASPRLRFNLGQVANNQPAISPILPNIPEFPASAYYITQWQQRTYIEPNRMHVNDPAAFDVSLGIAKYAFEAIDGHSHVWVFPYNGGWAYELYESGGSVQTGGGSNLFLGTDQFVQAALDRPISVDFDAKLSRASLLGSDQAQAGGAVLAQIFSGFGLLHTDPTGGKQQFVFMQIPIADSRPLSRAASFVCSGTTISLFSPNLNNGETLLPYVADPGPMHHFHYAVNGYLSDLVGSTACSQSWPIGASDPKNWQLTGFYIGLETEVADSRPSAPTNAVQGVQETALQIANLTIVRN